MEMYCKHSLIYHSSNPFVVAIIVVKYANADALQLLSIGKSSKSIDILFEMQNAKPTQVAAAIETVV